MSILKKRTALILCTGNSCRSQMAEAIINEKNGDSWHAFSAGTEPVGYMHPKAIAVLKEIGIEHQGVSKNIYTLPIKDFALVITVCDDAAENCPSWLGSGKRIHIGIEDPAMADGTEKEIMAVFRDVRNNIEKRVLSFLIDLN